MNLSFFGNFGRRLPRAAVLIGGLMVVHPSPAADAGGTRRLGVGATFETLEVKAGTVYHHIEVRSINARTVMISHSGGMAAVRLKDLSPDLQAAFGYDAAADSAADTTLRNEQSAQQQRLAEQSAARRTATLRAPEESAFEQLLRTFGQPPQLRPGVDLRPKFAELALNVKNQGARPSCAIFAIVSALEYQNALLTGKPERFSEEYLLWATCKTLNRAPRARPEAIATAEAVTPDNVDNIDEGFALPEVVTALRAYGIPLQESLPYSFARRGTRADPAPEVLEQARSLRKVSVIGLPGRDKSTVLANLIHTLNAGMPVAVGMAWPLAQYGHFLNAQRAAPDRWHAVTIVGYENKTDSVADTVFVFKNSWGVKWGVGGYGFVSYRYLFNNLVDTALLDVSTSGAAPVRK